MARPLKDPARDTRREILDAALELFAQNGFFGTSMRQIAREVGVRESALYHHFPSKGAIMTALMDELGPGMMEQFAHVLGGPALEVIGAEQLLRRIAHRMIEEWATPRGQKFARLMMAEGPRLGSGGPVHPQAIFGKGRALLTRMFEEMIRRKQIKKLDPEVLALAFMGPMIALRMMYLVMSGTPHDLRALKAEVDGHLRFFWQAVRP